MRIGYAKLGRTIQLDPAKFGIVGGDDEPPFLLRTLARRHPEHEFVLVGRHSDDEPQVVGLPPNVTPVWTAEMRAELKARHGDLSSPMTRDEANRFIAACDELVRPVWESLDQAIVWTGQHGTVSQPTPYVKGSWDDDKYTKPQDWMVLYASHVLRGLAAWRDPDPIAREEVWLCPDPRNMVKCRDLKWPLRHPCLSQYETTKRTKHERFRDPRTPEGAGFDATVAYTHWVSKQRYVYSRLEICGILPEHVDAWYFEHGADREHFGLFINEARRNVKISRRDALAEFVLPLRPYFIHGKWSPESQTELGVEIEPAPAEVYYDKLRSVRCTFTTPSSGSGWATTKPWQAFATGTVCFFHPEYDTQGHIIPTLKQVERGEVDDPNLAHLARWLRVRDVNDLATRVRACEDEDTWRWLSRMQRQLYDDACRELRHVKMIEERLGLETQ